MANWWDMPAGWKEGDPPPILNSPLGPVEAGPKAGGVYVKLNGRSGGVPKFGGLSLAKNRPGYEEPAAEVAPQQAAQPAQPTPRRTYGMQGKQPQGASQPQQYGGMKGKQSQGASRPQQYNGGTPMGQNTQQMQGKQSKQQPGQYNTGSQPMGQVWTQQNQQDSDQMQAYKAANPDQFNGPSGIDPNNPNPYGGSGTPGNERIYTGPGSDPNADQNDVFGVPEGFKPTSVELPPMDPNGGLQTSIPQQVELARGLRGAPDPNRAPPAAAPQPSSAPGPGNAPPLADKAQGMQGKQSQVPQQYMPQVQQMLGKQPRGGGPASYQQAPAAPKPAAPAPGRAPAPQARGLSRTGVSGNAAGMGNRSENRLAKQKADAAADRTTWETRTSAAGTEMVKNPQTGGWEKAEGSKRSGFLQGRL